MAEKNPRLGSTLESLLGEDGSYEDAKNQAIKAVLAHKREAAMKAQHLSKAAAVKLYEMGRLSTGAAAQLAGVPKPVFLMKLADYGVDTFDLTKDKSSE